uniref:Aureusidin synthase-like protein n=1 Tax=Oncidium hybrid cultivar TaxID=141207 RepID=A0A0U1VG68_ONCHC|nr:aureusidin synthase-like protein [Oncidium hybrid cultivar]
MIQTLSLPKRFLLLFSQLPASPCPHYSPLLLLLPLLFLAFLLLSPPQPPHRPIQAPNLSECHPIFVSSASNSPLLNCCPPILSPPYKILDFTFPLPNSPLRTRRPAHLLDSHYISQYSKAVQLMKDLPDTDPRSFYQQANVHCAYCNGAYDQPGFSNLQLRIHGSWLFFPWHRFYLYFHERILAKLIGDDSFALPFWNWDEPAGMQMPSAFVNNNSSSLYHPTRNPSHLPPVLVDLNFHEFWLRNQSDENAHSVDDNLRIMYRQMIQNGATSELFMGSAIRAGDHPEPGGGSVEFVPHDTVHTWTGDPRNHNDEDMGAFYSAARDPLFYPHHANIDRLWSVWKTLGPKHKDFSDSDWLDSTFHFYDEEARLVRVKIRDCIDMDRLRYRYQEVDNQWINMIHRTKKKKKKRNIGIINMREKVKFPVSVGNEAVVVSVKRPKRGGKEEVEVLVIEGIEIDGTDYSVRFDVYVNAWPDDFKRPNARECAGSFVSLPRLGRVVNGRTNLKLGIGELIEEEEDYDEAVTVALVPRKGKATVSAVYITWLS